jgi:prepilin-type N-terminal cleavage/methylation domain-containing protein
MFLTQKNYNPKSHKLKPISYKKGFSLVELLVVIGIFTVITSVVVYRQSQFSSDILITNLAYQMALEIRQAQTYGIGVRGVGEVVDESLRFQYAYGIHLGQDISSVPSSPINSFVLFVDSYSKSAANESLGNDFVYGSEEEPASDEGEHLETFKLPGGNTILDFCNGVFGTPDFICNSDASSPLNTLDISFLRPRPDAHITKNNDNNPANALAGPVTIVLKSALGDKCKSITVLLTGQISVSTNNISCEKSAGYR